MCALVTGVQTCALPILTDEDEPGEPDIAAIANSIERVAGNHLAGGKLAPQKRNRMLPQGQADMAIILDDLPPLLHRLEPHGLLDDFMDKSVLAGVRRREPGKLLVEQRLDRPERIAARKAHRHQESDERKDGGKGRRWAVGGM